MKFYYLIFFIPLIFNPFGFYPFISAKIFWFLIFLASSILFFNPHKILRHRQLELFLTFNIILILISAIFSGKFYQSFFGEIETFSGAIAQILFLLNFWFCLQIFKNKKFECNFLRILIFIGVITSIHGLWQVWQDNAAEFSFRAFSTLGAPNFLGQFLIFPWFILFFDFMHFLKVTSRKVTFNENFFRIFGNRYKNNSDRKRLKIFAIKFFALILISLAIFATKNRATILAILGSLGIYGYLNFPIKKIYKIISLTIFTLISTSLIVICNFSIRSLFSRFALWKSVFLNLNLKTFLIGHGANNFTENFVLKINPDIFNNEEFFTLPFNAHNFFLQIFFENGIFGLILWILAIYFLLSTLNKSPKTGFPLLAFYLSLQFSFIQIEHAVILAGFWAIHLHQTLKLKIEHFITKGLKQLLQSMRKFALIFLAILLLIFAGQILITDFFLKKGIENYIFTPKQSFARFKIATKIAPQFAASHKILIDLFADENWQKVEPHLKIHQKITSGNFENEILKMKFFAAKNDYKNFEKSFISAQSLAPNLPIIFLIAGNFYFTNKNCPKTILVFEKLCNLAPQRAWDINGNNKKAARIFRKHAPGFVEAMKKLEYCKSF